jgi:predicted signal transduction protein with EAL and GGDEF domain
MLGAGLAYVNSFTNGTYLLAKIVAELCSKASRKLFNCIDCFHELGFKTAVDQLRNGMKNLVRLKLITVTKLFRSTCRWEMG